MYISPLIPKTKTLRLLNCLLQKKRTYMLLIFLNKSNEMKPKYIFILLNYPAPIVGDKTFILLQAKLILLSFD